MAADEDTETDGLVNTVRCVFFSQDEGRTSTVKELEQCAREGCAILGLLVFGVGVVGNSRYSGRSTKEMWHEDCWRRHPIVGRGNTLLSGKYASVDVTEFHGLRIDMWAECSKY